MLLKRGEAWYESFGNLNTSGRSATEPIVIGAYGNASLPRPVIKVAQGSGAVVMHGSSATNNFAFVSIDFYSHTRDPFSPTFVGQTALNSMGGGIGMEILRPVDNVLIEDCKFSYFGLGLSFLAFEGAGTIKNIKLRRSTIKENFNTLNQGHGGGIYVVAVYGLLVEENVFDHNGWSEDVANASATVFRHSMYIDGYRDNNKNKTTHPTETRDIVIKGNIVYNSAATGTQLRCGGVLENNLYFKNPVTMFFADTASIVRKNVVLDGSDIMGANGPEQRGWGMEFQATDGSSIVEQNIVANKPANAGQGFAFAIKPRIDGVPGGPIAIGRKLTFQNNIAYNWPGHALQIENPLAWSDPDGSGSLPPFQNQFWDSVFIRNNQLQALAGNSYSLVSATHWPWLSNPYPLERYKLRNNKYASTLNQNNWFSVFISTGGNVINYNLASWQAGHNGTNDLGSTSTTQSYIAPNRSVSTYNQSLGGAATYEAFMTAAVNNRKGNWDTRYTAKAVNNYIRDGFRTPLNYSFTPNTTICSGNSVTLSLNSINRTNYSLSWNGGAATTNTSFVVTPTVTTTYSVVINDTDEEWLYTSPIVHYITVTVGGSLPITVSGNRAICSGQNTTLSASGGNTYQWNNGATTSSITVSPTTTTNYSVVGTGAGNCTGSVSVTVTVTPTPTVNITGATATCMGSAVILTATGASSYSWLGTSVTTASFSATPTIATTYSVIGSNGNCSATATKAIAIYQLPTVSITGNNSPICSGNTLNLTGNGANTYYWSGNNNSQGFNPTFLDVPNSTTIYTLFGQNSNGCIGTTTATVTVNASPSVSISGNNVICRGERATLNASGANTYAWNTSATTSSIFVNPTVNTTYSVTGTGAGNCIGLATITVTVTPTPTVTISGPTSLCNGSSATLIASGASEYTWSGPVKITTYTLSVSPEMLTSYTVEGTTNKCSSIAVHTISVGELPAIIISGNNNLCNGSSTSLSASGGLEYLWLWNFNQQSSVQNPLVNMPSQTTEYSLVGKGANGCLNVASIIVTVNPLPTVAIEGSNEICTGATTNLIATGANSYVWTHGPNTASISVSPTVATTYSVIGTSVNNCQASASKTITINPNLAPTINISGDNTICQGDQTLLSATGANSYVWSTGASSQSIAVSPEETTSYFVTGLGSNNCSNVSTMIVSVDSLPNVTITTTTVSGSVVLNAVVQQGISYQWYDCRKDTLIPEQTAASYTPTKKGDYAVILTTAEGCKDTSDCIAVQEPNLITSIITGLPQNANNGLFTVYPNPNSGEFNIELPENLSNQIVHFVVTNSFGQTVHEFDVNPIDRRTSNVSIANLANGLYRINSVLGSKTLVKVVN